MIVSIPKPEVANKKRTDLAALFNEPAIGAFWLGVIPLAVGTLIAWLISNILGDTEYEGSGPFQWKWFALFTVPLLVWCIFWVHIAKWSDGKFLKVSGQPDKTHNRTFADVQCTNLNRLEAVLDDIHVVRRNLESGATMWRSKCTELLGAIHHIEYQIAFACQVTLPEPMKDDFTSKFARQVSACEEARDIIVKRSFFQLKDEEPHSIIFANELKALDAAIEGFDK